MAFLTDDNTTYVDNNVYRIDASDALEGFSAGAAFGGLGIDNEPHQVLANRTAFLKRRQDVNISNLATLAAFNALFTGQKTAVGYGGSASGYFKIPYMDVAMGPTLLYLQYGFISFIGQTAAAIANSTQVQNYPVAFPNACFKTLTTLTSNFAHTAVGALDVAALSVEPIHPFTKTQATFYIDYNGQGVLHIADGVNKLGLTGMEWVAIGN